MMIITYPPLRAVKTNIKVNATMRQSPTVTIAQMRVTVGDGIVLCSLDRFAWLANWMAGELRNRQRECLLAASHFCYRCSCQETYFDSEEELSP